MKDLREQRGAGVLLVASTMVSAALWIGSRNLGLALMPMLALAVSWCVLRCSIRWPVAGLFFVALLVENPQARPMEEEWRSPLFAAGNLLYTNLNTLTGVELLRFSLFELLLLVLVSLLFIRRVGGIGRDGVAPVSMGGRWLVRLLGLALLTVLFLELRGLLRGGDLRQSLWQLRQLLWLPALGWLALHAFHRRGDEWLVGGILILAGIGRALAGFAYYAISRAGGHTPAYITTHADSMLWLMGVIICLAALVEKPAIRTWALSAAYLPLAGLALLLNDRRLAFVCLGAAVIVLLVVARREVWLRVRKLVLFASPALLLYLAVGWNVQHRVFSPVQTLKSVLDESDTSNHSRDVENFNLIFTALERPLFGSGFGHPYSEHIYTYRIDHVFEQYSYMPHNSLLWLFSIGGILGFLGLWAFLPFVVWLCARAYRCAGSLSQRVAALGGIAVVVAYVLTAWGDMGVHSWMVTLILAAYVGLVGNLERYTGAWRLEGGSHQPKAADGATILPRMPVATGGSAC
ncbi:MAG: O-antigen ligase family protein [Myxococcota bacterium]